MCLIVILISILMRRRGREGGGGGEGDGYQTTPFQHSFSLVSTYTWFPVSYLNCH